MTNDIVTYDTQCLSACKYYDYPPSCFVVFSPQLGVHYGIATPRIILIDDLTGPADRDFKLRQESDSIKKRIEISRDEAVVPWQRNTLIHLSQRYAYFTIQNKLLFTLDWVYICGAIKCTCTYFCVYICQPHDLITKLTFAYPLTQ